MKLFLPVLISVFFILEACASAPKRVQVQLKYTPGNNRQVSLQKAFEGAGPCVVGLDISDDRIDKEHLGCTDTPIYGSNVTEWVYQGIVSIPGFRFLSPKRDVDENLSGLWLKVNVKRTSCRGTLMHMRCTVLMEGEYFNDGKPIKKARYYGAEMDDNSIFGRSNHFGENSVLNTLNAALDQCIVKIEFDLKNLSQNLP